MSIEYWGTYSVRDHLARRAFIADVLLYDRLLIPTLPGGDSEEDWPAEWQLARQRKLLDQLGDLVIPVPWTNTLRTEWRNRYDKEGGVARGRERAHLASAAGRDARRARDPANAKVDEDHSYHITREVLRDTANDGRLLRKLRAERGARPGAEVRAMTAYQSYRRFAGDQPKALAAKQSPALSPTTVFGWEFFVPESADIGFDADRRLLDKAIKLARKTEFIERRDDFYGLWQDIREGRLDRDDAKQLVEKRLSGYRDYIRGQRWKKRARYALEVLPALIPFGGAIASTFSHAGAELVEWSSASAGLFLSAASIPVRGSLAASAPQPDIAAAAMFHDARRHFGWKSA